MQDLLTAAATALLFTAPAYLTAMFALGLFNRYRAAAPSTASVVAPTVPQRPVVCDVVVPFIRPVRKADLSGLSIRQLKAIAKAAKLPKYSNNTSTELNERLSALPDIAALLKAAA